MTTPTTTCKRDNVDGDAEAGEDDVNKDKEEEEDGGGCCRCGCCRPGLVAANR